MKIENPSNSADAVVWVNYANTSVRVRFDQDGEAEINADDLTNARVLFARATVDLFSLIVSRARELRDSDKQLHTTRS